MTELDGTVGFPPLRCMGGPLDGREVSLRIAPGVRFVDVPVPMTGGIGRARYVIESVGGRPTHLAFVGG